MSTSESVGVWLDNFWGDEAGITILESGAGLDDASGKYSVAEMEISERKVGLSISPSVGGLDAFSSSET